MAKTGESAAKENGVSRTSSRGREGMTASWTGPRCRECGARMNVRTTTPCLGCQAKKREEGK